jgi:RNA polymerase sigma-70 factor (ECF subfamily)
MSPEELALFHDGDARFFATLVRDVTPRLLGAAISLTGDRAAAHDLTHDAWVQAFAARRSYRGEGSFAGWMLAVLRNCQRAAHRTDTKRAARGQVYAEHAAGEHAHAFDAPDEALDREKLRARLVQGLVSLGDRQRDVVVMRILEERSVAETARLLGIAEGTVKATLAQAIGRLRNTLRSVE